MATTHWTLEDIDWSAFDPGAVDEELLAVVKTAALVEANSEDYVTYLHNVFPDDEAFKRAADYWGEEEAQHGLALGRWAELADKQFSFDASLKYFRSVYSLPLEVAQSVRGSRGGELLARCVVESGTCSFYSAIRDFTDEPVLRQICHRIAQDESKHYRLFFEHGRNYPQPAMWERLRIALGRVLETEDDEFGYAYYSANHLAESDLKPYDRAECAGTYQRMATSMYRAEHVRTVVHMIALALGVRPQHPLVRAIGRVGWWSLRRRNRSYKSRVASAGAA